MTHTYAILEVTPATFEEISDKLKARGYSQSFIRDHTNDPTLVTIDMQGLALQKNSTLETEEERRDNVKKKALRSIDVERIIEQTEELQATLERVKRMLDI